MSLIWKFDRCIAAIAGTLGFMAFLPAQSMVASAQTSAIELDAELGQSVLLLDKLGKVYLRLSLKGMPIATRKERSPVNVAIVLDRSGSMKGDRIASAKAAGKVALERLSEQDIVSLVAYNHEVEVLQPAAPLGNSKSLTRKIDSLMADGRTALHAGVVSGAAEVKRNLNETRVNRVILLSDGMANVGPSSPRELAELGRKLGAEGISVSTIGLGLDYNEDLMQRLAAASDGKSSDGGDARSRARRPWEQVREIRR